MEETNLFVDENDIGLMQIYPVLATSKKKLPM